MFKNIATVLLASSFLAGCINSPTGRSQFIFMPDAQVNQMGLEAFDTLKKQKQIRNVGKMECIFGSFLFTKLIEIIHFFVLV